jgi:hypothetical protein
VTKRTQIDTGTIDWVPAGEILADYHVDTGSPDTGVFLKVLRRPEDGGGCWHWLIRFTPPAGRGIRITAVAESDEEIFFLRDESPESRTGVYACNEAGLRHGITVTGETVALVHYHGAPDRILRAEVVELQGAAS